MTEVYFMYTHPADGTLRIVAGAPMEQLETSVAFKGNVAKYKAFVRSKSIPEGAIGVQEMPEGWKPPFDRSFRNAWKRRRVDNNFTPEIDIDMPKAREIQRAKVRYQHMRRERDAGLDEDMAGASENVKRANANARRQNLRNVLTMIDAAQTPDELRAITL